MTFWDTARESYARTRDLIAASDALEGRTAQPPSWLALVLSAPLDFALIALAWVGDRVLGGSPRLGDWT